MNCKQGDLAIFVTSNAGNEGKIVTCLRRATQAECDNYGFNPYFHGPVWFTDKQLFTIYDTVSNLACDAHLRPIRDQDGEDEMIRIAGKPVIQELPQTVAISNK